MAGAGQPALPNLIVIGAMKCGTSALHYYLSLHPDVQMSSPKELNYFCESARPPEWVRDPDAIDERIMRGWEHNWERGSEWYSRHFDAKAAVRGEASPNYTAPWEAGVAERMAAVLPGAKLVFMVRDPVAMIASQHAHNVAEGIETRKLAAALANPRSPYLARARYAACLDPFLAVFGRDRFLFIDQARLLSDRRETMRRVFEFCEVDPGFWDDRMDRLRHESAAKNRRTRALRRIQDAGARPLVRLVPEAPKYWIERLVSAGGGTGEPDEADPAVVEAIGEAIGDDAPRLRRITGLELGDWSW
jgi:hypothetical protein